ncbi:MAG: PHP domain-containing protein [Candidatus Omnitrophica bacterium]|nr:PHP domain-containing protein [Candidatus Omnitrophota bacterium]
MKYADLHLHTSFSDGTYSPEQLVSASVKAGLSAIAVVDHDTVDGIEPVIKAASGEGLEVLAGIELSAEYQEQEVHILGYLIDYRNRELLSRLGDLKIKRRERIYKIVERLKRIGIVLNPETIFAIAGGGSVGRLHVARAMVREGIINSVYEAFHKYIGDKCPGYVLGFKFSAEEAIGLIRDIGAVPVLAHPYSLNNDELVIRFIDYGIMGLEVYYPEHTQSMINVYLSLVKKYNLLVTGGSDCHGEAKPAVRIGSMKIPYELVEKLKEAKAAIER